MRARVGLVVGVVILVGLTGLFVWQLSLAEPEDFVVPVAIPAALLAVAAVVELQVRIGRWAWRRAAADPTGEVATDYDEGEAGAAKVRGAAGQALGCAGGCASVLLAIPLWASPGLAAVLVSAEQHEKAQQRAITQVYGEPAYAAGVRIGKGGMLNTGFPAHPDAVRIYRQRSWLPHFAALALTALAADWLLRRHFGAGYNGDRPLIDLDKARRIISRARRDSPAE